jgi:hypothetical protein
MLADFALYRLSDGYIENVIWYDPDTVQYTPEEGFGLVEIPGENGLLGAWSMCGIGWSYINGQFIEPPPPPEPVQPVTEGAQTL